MTSSQSTIPSGSDTIRLYRSIFRLHFYAGLIVAPFLLILSVTGAIYLFNTEIEDLTYGDWRFAQVTGDHLAPGEMVDGALAAYPGATPTRIDLPTSPERSATVFLTSRTGEPFRVFVDPVSGKALGAYSYEDSLIGISDQMHGALLLGEHGDNLVELAACWTIVLVLTGLFLWWPRGTNRIMGVILPRCLKGRGLWRDVHAVTGFWTSMLLMFLLLTGLPWSTNWGNYLQQGMTMAGIGYPEAYRTHINHDVEDPVASKPLGETNPGLPWTLEPAPSPVSGHAHHQMTGQPITVTTAASIFASAGLTTAYRLIYPKDAHDVFTAYTYPDKPEGQRTIHLDQYTGEVINDIAYADYGIGAKAVELGVQLHMGNYFGTLNQIIMLVAALGGVLLAFTGPVMWLKRRKAGLGAPPPAASGSSIRAIAVLLVILGVLFPALGITALLIFALERFVLSRIPPVRDWLGLRVSP